MLFQNGPALKSRVGNIGNPGGLHYETSQVLEDHPQNMLAAATRALDSQIVAEAQRDTALLLKIFVEAAGENAEQAPSVSQMGNRDVEDGADEFVGRRGEDKRDLDAVACSLFCEEEDLEEDLMPACHKDGNTSQDNLPTWYADAEKRVLEQCARRLYVISTSRQSAAVAGHAGRRKKGSAH